MWKIWVLTFFLRVQSDTLTSPKTPTRVRSTNGSFVRYLRKRGNSSIQPNNTTRTDLNCPFKMMHTVWTKCVTYSRAAIWSSASTVPSLWWTCCKTLWGDTDDERKKAELRHFCFTSPTQQLRPYELREVPLTSEPRASAVQSSDDDLLRSHQHPLPVRPELFRHRLVTWRTAAVGTQPVKSQFDLNI